jgi:NADP-dependent 3-hydroxy acid dehydrogenase YdfG
MNILITGSSSGIGETVARRLVDEGHKIVMLARRGDLLKTLADELNHDGRYCTTMIAGIC